MHFFFEKNTGKVWSVNKKPYLCIVKNKTGGFVERLDYGVMVTQQILVLFFQVRVLVVQRKFRLKLKSSREIYCFFYVNNSSLTPIVIFQSGADGGGDDKNKRGVKPLSIVILSTTRR